MSTPQPRLALVTGATRGIGHEIARQLAEQGVRVLLSGRDRAAAEAAAQAMRGEGLDVEGLELDVTSTAGIAAALAVVEREHGRLDILVNNAGIRVEQYGRQPSEQPMRHWRETFETNLFGLVEVTTAFLPLIRRSDAGRVVNVSSLLGSLTAHSDTGSYTYSDAFKSLPAYSASKSGVNSWTVHLAYELRDTPVKVNSVHPGYTKTDLNDGAGEFDVTAGARTSVRMALLDDAGPSGTYQHLGEVLPW
ncbi:SDR family oxidoreductase [Actinokineospora sp. NBRC 105648]|uniref:SDR family oxidoreductase n=1 Tax=Actinokineospora sp. NBRC 105648 TaxID=3032206 RepID=UPI0024A232DD|nr:SDR family oxidoreductase [Actinokineospora sp. NBRC 105648]GLZ38071.1 short-chain dehydrogenase [Actinokineospora sp. NBRC 105648]